MSDESSDEYHEDSLPDLVLSSSIPEETSLDFLDFKCPHYLPSSVLVSSAPDLLVPGLGEVTDIETEYFQSGDQAKTTFHFVLI
jgi:hypothetical protein